MSLEGLKKVIFRTPSGTYEAGRGDNGAVSVEWKDLDGSLNDVWGSDIKQATYKSSAKTTATVTVNGISLPLLGELVGWKKTSDGVYVPQNDAKLPTVGFLAVTHLFNTDTDQVSFMPSANATYTKLSLKTNTDKKNLATVAIDFSAIHDEKLGGMLGFKNVPSGDISSVLTLLGWDEPKQDVEAGADSGTVSPSGK